MKKNFDKVKTCLASLSIALASFLSKVFGQWLERYPQTKYWVVNTLPVPVEQIGWSTPTSITIKIAQLLLIAVIPIIWIMNFIKIRKMDDKLEKQRKINITIIVIAVLILILSATFLIPALLLAK